MKILTGTDIIEIDRIKDSIENLGNKFTREIFTETEIDYCESKKQSKYQHYAARFAAKEAIFKAISELLNDKYDVTWKNAEVVNDDQGKPHVHFINTDIVDKIQDIDISISHCKTHASVNVVVTTK